jgi:hypothetical protein
MSELILKAFEWSDPSPPNDYCPYNHTFADTPFGRYQIEWKGWKDHPGFTIKLAGVMIDAYAGETVERARELAFDDFSARIAASFIPSTPDTLGENQP